ncbi:MAG: YkgJ family cysteine cluster protein [Methanothrix sp.]|nr:YkgJ family cysteine cluster protein [Methanothrix sp.]
MREEIDRVIRAMQALKDLVPSGGLRNLDQVISEMDGMISPEFQPYFLANTALSLLFVCDRCGRCCREEKVIAVTIEDCRRIARYLGVSLKRFMKDYTRPHELKSELVGSARMLKKAPGESCPFYDPALPGCRIHSAKPQVCIAALYLSKMNLLICEEQKKVNRFPICSADGKMRARIAELSSRIKGDAGAKKQLDQLFEGARDEAELFHLLLRLKGMQIYFGDERATLLARRLGLARVPGDKEMRGAALLYALEITGLMIDN